MRSVPFLQAMAVSHQLPVGLLPSSPVSLSLSFPICPQASEKMMRRDFEAFPACLVTVEENLTQPDGCN
jgi:hypothetical protein